MKAPVAVQEGQLQPTAADYARQSLSENTLSAYRSDWHDFTAWCRREGREAMPAAPDTVASYLTSLARTHGRSALRRRLCAIGQAHRLKGAAWDGGHPLIRHTLRGILRAHGVPIRQAAALATAEIKRLVATCHTDLAGKRDRALILIGYAAALRRSEIVGITLESLKFTREGLTLHIPRSKSDPEGEGADIGIPRGTRSETCPVRAMEEWIRASRCRYGPVFRRVDTWGNVDQDALHPDGVRQIIRKRAELAGLTIGQRERLSPHGLRAGFITEAYRAGVPDEAIMEHSRHKDHATMRRYIRRAKLVDESPVKKLGL